VAARYVDTIFPAHVSERAQFIPVVVVGQEFNWKPVGIGTARSRSVPNPLNDLSKGSALARLTTAEL